VIFAVSVWNGGGFYIEVFGRKFVLCLPCAVSPDLDHLCPFLSRFERELEALRKELANTIARSGNSTPDHLGRVRSDSDSSMALSPLMADGSLPSVTPLELSPKLFLPQDSKKDQ
jgi:hypothetical protein